MTTPRATYRLQVHRGFTLHDAADVVEYLAALGVSHVYLSPILQAAPGSTHGYDCTDPDRFDADRGGRDGFDALSAACSAAGLGIVLDIVPNHLDISGPENRWWWSVLRFGTASPWARVFDVDWERAMRPGGGIALPILGGEVEEVYVRGELALGRKEGAIEVHYHDHRLPLSPSTIATILRGASERADPEVAARLHEIDAAMRSLDQGAAPAPGADAADAPPVTLSIDDRIARLEAALNELMVGEPRIAEAVDAELAFISGDLDRLNEVLTRQVYRLVHWRESAREIGYRRFFDINTLIGVRVEDPAVFERTHGLICELVRSGRVDGLRVDHPDGLRDPAAYTAQLRQAAPEAWIVLEKILESDELLPPWPVAGTTGYDFLNDCLGVLIDGRGERLFRALYAEVTGAHEEYGEVAFEAKLYAARKILAADLTRLTRLALHLSKVQPRLRDRPVRLREAIGLLAACMPVYRTYVVPGSPEVSPGDAERIWTARGHAERRRPELTPDPLGAIRDILLLRLRSPVARDRRSLEGEFVYRFQQYSSPAMAKGVEDTAFYRYVAFVALNEVGGDPSRFGITPGRFHARNMARARRWPETMLATSTHDTKRSEDVRARLAVLSEIPEEWAQTVRRWRRLNEHAREERGGVPAGREEYLLYQTLAGAWPIDVERVSRFMRKAAREAKVWTSWLHVNERYESQLDAFVRNVMANRTFINEVKVFVGQILRPGRVNSLVQTLLKLTCPGVPDIYQGCDLWDLSLVDPDNRRPVDFALRRGLLSELESTSPGQIWGTLDESDDPGRAKLWLTAQVLRHRARFQAAFAKRSSYTPLFVSGRFERHVIAYARGDSEGPRALVVAPCLSVARARSVGGPEASGEDDPAGWGNTAISIPPPLDSDAWSHVLAGGRVGPGECRVGELLAEAPVALLVESTDAV